MKRIYSNYPEYEYDEIVKEAEKRGLSQSAFQRYCVMLYMAEHTPCHDFLSQGFFDSIHMRLDGIKPGDTFTVSDLFSNEWSQFSKSQKMIMAKRLVKFSHLNPHICSIYQSDLGKPTVYIKKTGVSF